MRRSVNQGSPFGDEGGLLIKGSLLIELRPNIVPQVKQAEDWRWSSLYRWFSGTAAEKGLLSAWPLRRNAGWLDHVNSPQTDAELAAIRRSVNRGSPFGDETWATTATRKLGLEITTRPQGRPKLK